MIFDKEDRRKEVLLPILVGFWGKGKEKTFNLYPLTFSPNPIPS
jgi:hypothetical protein